MLYYINVIKVMTMLRTVKNPRRKEKKEITLNSPPALTGLRLGTDALVGLLDRVCYL
jgi:hypothetical protein